MRAFALLLLLCPLHVFAADDSAEHVVATLWRAMSNEAGGQADAAALRRIFHPEAVVFGGRYRDGVPSLRRSSGDEFLKAFDGVQAKGFHECEVHRAMQAYDRFAVAYSVVESREDPSSAQADFVGVNSVQLYRDGTQWQVLSLYYHVEAKDTPIPLDGGTSGVCIGG